VNTHRRAPRRGRFRSVPVLAAITDTANTYGWDTVFAVHIADVNRAIEKAGRSPKTFNASDNEDAASASGTFGPWRVTTGGDGDLVRLTIPITSATVSVSTSTEQVAGTAEVDVRLDFLRKEDGGSLCELRVSTAPVDQGAKAASVSRIAYVGHGPCFLANAALTGLLEKWLNEHLDAFDHVFATANLNRPAASGAFQWLQPTYTAYAYSDLGTSDDGALGVLCMTEGRSAEGLVQQISPKALPDGQRAGFQISKQRVLSNLLLPAMPSVFKGSSAADYKLSPSGDTIVNATQTVNFHVQPEGQSPCAAQVLSLSITIDAQELQMEVLTRTNLAPGIDAYCRTQTFLAIHLVDKADGTQTIGFKDAQPSVTNHWTEQAEAITVGEEILAIAAIVAAVIVGIVTAGAGFAVAALIIGIVAGIAYLTTTLIETVGNDDAPPIDAVVLDCTAPIVWSDSGDFRVGSVSLNDSLQLGGDPCFAQG
jgi:hypothetical protein